jgi:hypothetical protein
VIGINISKQHCRVDDKIWGTRPMPRRRSGNLLHMVFVLGMAAALSACSHAEAVINQPAPQAAANANSSGAAGSEPAVVATPMTREKASTDCWMKYEKDGRSLSLDQRLPLVEKCTAEKLKAAAR